MSDEAEGSTYHNVETSMHNPETSNQSDQQVIIDQNKLMEVHEQLVLVTDGFCVEALERTYANLAKVVRCYRCHYDRTQLPSDLLRQIKLVSQADDVQQNFPEMTVSNSNPE